MTNKSGVKAHAKEKETTLDIVKSVCEKYGLTRREAFEIHSQFKAMTIPFEKKKPGTSANDDYIDALLKLNKTSVSKNNTSKSNLNESSNSPQNTSNHLFGEEEKPEGIKLDYFGENCSFLHGVHPEVKTRLFKAIGIDTESKSSIIKWKEYVELYCIWKLGILEKDELIRFWGKFLDPASLGLVSQSTVEDILEKLIRGNSLKEPNQGTTLFAKNCIKVFENNEWVENLNDEMFINVSLIRQKFKSDEIDMQILSDALGNKLQY